MAGDWIKWVKGLAKRPEVLHMAGALGRSRHEVAGLVMEFWEWADDNVDMLDDVSANFPGSVRDLSANCPGFVRFLSASHAAVDALIGVPGFADAMTAVGWLVVHADALEFPKFGRHNGKHAKRRALDAERKDARREIPQNVRKMSASQADRLRTREEKRREEYIGLSSGESCGDLSETGSPPPVVEAQDTSRQRPEERPTATEPAVMTFPCVGQGPSEWPLTVAKVAEYRTAFPDLDVEAQCRAALQWCRDNRAKRKTATGMASFLTRWLTKAQNDGRPQARLSGGGFAAARGIIRVDNEADYGPAPP